MEASEEDENGGLFNIDVSSDEEARKEKERKVPRDFQSEEDFQRQLKEWKPKVERGEVCAVSMFTLLGLDIFHVISQK